MKLKVESPILAVCASILVCGWLLPVVHGANPAYLSPATVVADRGGQRLYVGEVTANQVAVVDLASAKVVQVYALPDPPSGLALSPDGKRLYVSGAVPAGRVHVVEVASGQVVKTLPAGHTPTAPVVSPDGRRLYVCNQYQGTVSMLDVESGEELGRVAVGREPVAAAITPDGRWLYVAHLLPAGAADGEYTAAVVTVLDLEKRQVSGTIALPNGSSSLQGICVSPDGQYVYVTHTLGRYQMPTTQLERGWMNTSAVSVIAVAGSKLVNTVLVDDVDLGGANPWGVGCTADGQYLCVTHAGTHELSVIDRAGMHAKLSKVAAGEKVSEVSLQAGDVPNDLSFLVGLRRRVSLGGNGPRGLAVVGKRVYVAEYYSDSLGVVDLGETGTPRVSAVALGPVVARTAQRWGEQLFHDAKICFQQWQSCASCHPNRGRVDGLNWDLLNDGMGNPKNTKSMLLAHRTPPSMSLGVREEAPEAVRAGIRHILFSVRPEAEAEAMDAYLTSLRPVPSPYLANGKRSAAAERGQKVFEQAGCGRCHPAPLYTDMKPYAVGTGKGLEKGQAFDTPTLVEVWRTGPYLHDGRAATLKEVLTRFNPENGHGKTSGLSETELGALVEFVLSL